MEKQTQKRKFLFNVDIMIEDDTNGRALERLLHLLNSAVVEDYQIKQGIELGKKIEIALKQSIRKGEETRVVTDRAEDASKSKEAPQAAAGKPQDKAQGKSPEEVSAANASDDPYRRIWEQLTQLKEKNKLIRLTVLKGKGIKLSLPCRVLNVEPASGNVSVYHVDEKKVYLFRINEIDDFEER